MRRIVLVTAVAAVMVGGQVWADVVRLKDGTSIEGDVKKADNGGWVVTLPGGETTAVPAESVKSIEAGGGGQGGKGDAMAGLGSLRRASANQDDPGQVIERYKRFVGQYAGTPAAEEAKQDLAMWQERQEKGMVRVGTRWVTKQERGRMEQDALRLADQARQKIKDGKWHDAEGLLAEALAADPNAAAALYLRSLVEYQAGQYVAARKDLERVKSLAPDHGPTLNNLGVIAVRQNRMGEAVNYLDQAMLAEPADRTVLDNTAEVLHALSEQGPRANVQKGLVQRTAAAFQEQDVTLAAKMKEQGLNRWGATWVSDADMAKLQAAQKQIDAKKAAMQADFDGTQRLIAGIDDRIASDELTMRQLESESFRQDINGALIQVPLPSVYYDVQRDIQNQRAARQQAVAKLDGLRQRARNLQQELPIPKYTGALQVVGADGAPVVLSPPATAEAAAATKPGG
jgi:Tfp pilus assembly protein PilF